jgi:DNA mismatch repair protein MutL
VIDRIAAGEVVERPASVVKELLENSLDAGAGSIRVTLRNGGKTRIVIDDDGLGMTADEALLAVERHATSKLRDADDLEAIRTFGFRGEALSSIAAVSVFQLRTQAGEDPGVELNLRGGELESRRDSPGTRGTRIQVDRLFFNVPARRKFLRADATELAHVVRLVTRAALARHDVRFRLEHGNQTLLDAPATSSAGEVSPVARSTRCRGGIPSTSTSTAVSSPTA